MSGLGALLGLLAAVGLLLMVSFGRARRPLTVVERIRPFVAAPTAVVDSSRRRLSVADLMRGLLTQPSATSTVTGPMGSRLDRAGWRDGVARFRSERLAWTAVGGLTGAIVGVLGVAGNGSVVGVVLLGAVGGAAGRLARDQSLARAARSRGRLIDAQMPAAVELMALAVAAGEPIVAALERVGGVTPEPLGDEVAVVIADVRSGRSVESALDAMARRCGRRAVERFVDGLVVAIKRGTPLTAILRAQAVDARADGIRRLMEGAGRRDALMLVPVVFLVLPTVVAVALYPGIQTLRLVVP